MKKKLLSIVCLMIMVFGFNTVVFAGPGGGGAADPVITRAAHVSIEHQLESFFDN